MKPIILKVDSEDKLIITADEITEMVAAAYQDGYEDGKKAGYNYGNGSLTFRNPNPSTWREVYYTGGKSPSVLCSTTAQNTAKGE